jgi:hypothetical protein
MPINPAHFGSVTFLDFSNEKTTSQFHFPFITAVNIDEFLADFGDLRTAMEGIVLGTLSGDMWVGDKTKYGNAPPSDVNAQRERKFLVVYEDVTTLALYNMEIGTADFTGRLLDDTDLVDLTETDIATFITAFEVLARSPEGNNVNVVQIRAVGRAI